MVFGILQRQVLVADCVRETPKALRLPPGWQHPTDSTIITVDSFGDPWSIWVLERSDAVWLSDLGIDDLPIASLEVLITTIVDMENLSEGLYFAKKVGKPILSF